MFGAPLIFITYVLVFLYLESIDYRRFHGDVREKLAELEIEELEVSVCHEWKCHISYVKPEQQKHVFLIFGEGNLDIRFNRLQEIYKDFESNRHKCHILRTGSDICQL